MPASASVDRTRLHELIGREKAAYRAARRRSASAAAAAGAHLLGGVPMTWMRMWPGGFAPYLASAAGARVTDVDGNPHRDFCLGDTGAMAGHFPAPVQAAVARRLGDLGGVTTMLPNRGRGLVAAELARRFGLARWGFTLS